MKNKIASEPQVMQRQILLYFGFNTLLPNLPSSAQRIVSITSNALYLKFSNAVLILTLFIIFTVNLVCISFYNVVAMLLLFFHIVFLTFSITMLSNRLNNYSCNLIKHSFYPQRKWMVLFPFQYHYLLFYNQRK